MSNNVDDNLVRCDCCNNYASELFYDAEIGEYLEVCNICYEKLRMMNRCDCCNDIAIVKHYDVFTGKTLDLCNKCKIDQCLQVLDSIKEGVFDE